VITGVTAPAGRLTVTQYPQDFINEVGMTDMSLRPTSANPGRTYKWYTGKPVLEFGHGLHFTTFAFSWQRRPNTQYNIQQLLQVNNKQPLDLAPFDTFHVDIRNTGNITSDYVALLFLQSNSGPAPHPKKSLVSFARAHHINARSSTTLDLAVTLGSVARADENGDFWLYAGDYQLVLDIGDGVLSHSFTLAGDSARIVQWPRDSSSQK
jgi:beta-D-xylosidase 4